MQSLKSQLAAAETKLTEISSIVGKNHPTRLQLEAQIGELKQQLAAETRRVAGGTSVTSRGSSQKVAELQTMVDAQKKQLLSLRADHDQIAVYLRDVEAAQRAYDAVTQRLGQLNLEGQNNQANTRLLSPAVEPLEPSRPKIAGRHRRLDPRRPRRRHPRRARPRDCSTAASAVRRTCMVMAGVPVIGVLRPAGSKRPVFRRLLMVGPRADRRGRCWPRPGARS